MSLDDDDEVGLLFLLDLLGIGVKINVVDEPTSITDESEAE